MIRLPTRQAFHHPQASLPTLGQGWFGNSGGVVVAGADPSPSLDCSQNLLVPQVPTLPFSPIFPNCP